MTLNNRFKIKSPELGSFVICIHFGLEGSGGSDLIPFNIWTHVYEGENQTVGLYGPSGLMIKLLLRQIFFKISSTKVGTFLSYYTHAENNGNDNSPQTSI